MGRMREWSHVSSICCNVVDATLQLSRAIWFTYQPSAQHPIYSTELHRYSPRIRFIRVIAFHYISSHGGCRARSGFLLSFVCFRFVTAGSELDGRKTYASDKHAAEMALEKVFEWVSKYHLVTCCACYWWLFKHIICGIWMFNAGKRDEDTVIEFVESLRWLERQRLAGSVAKGPPRSARDAVALADSASTTVTR